MKASALMVLALLAAPAMAQDAPPMLAGLWESSIQVNGAALGTMQMCMDGTPGSLAALRSKSPRADRPRPSTTCDKPVVTPIPGGMRQELSCAEKDGPVTHSVALVTGDLKGHVRADITISRDGAPDIKNVIDMRRTGECPVGMTFGDTRMNIDQSAIANMAQAFGKAQRPPADKP